MHYHKKQISLDRKENLKNNEEELQMRREKADQ